MATLTCIVTVLPPAPLGAAASRAVTGVGAAVAAGIVTGEVVPLVTSVQFASVQPTLSLKDVIEEAVVGSVRSVVLPLNVVEVAVMCQPSVAFLLLPVDV